MTKAMAPTKSRYLSEKGEKGFDGKDYLELWASDNGQEVMEQERLEREAESTATPTPTPTQ